MLVISDLSFRYGKKKPLVLDEVNISLNDGEIGIVLGKNGSGKSTLFKNIVGIEKPNSGNIELNDESLLKASPLKRSSLVAYVPQSIEFGAMTVFDSILMGRVSKFGLKDGKKDREAVESIIKEMGLEELAMRNANQLSGGERQKVAIARALAQEPKLLVFDEPTGNLDLGNERLVLKEAKRLSKEKGISILVAIHDLNAAINFGNRFFFLKDGKIIHDGDASIINEETIRETFDADVEIIEANGKKIIISKEDSYE